MSITRKFLTVELTDGRILEERILYADQTRLAQTARNRQWDDDEKRGPVANALLAWAALRRTGQLDKSVTFEEFERDHLIDIDFRDEEAGAHTDAAEENPPVASETI